MVSSRQKMTLRVEHLTSIKRFIDSKGKAALGMRSMVWLRSEGAQEVVTIKLGV